MVFAACSDETWTICVNASYPPANVKNLHGQDVVAKTVPRVMLALLPRDTRNKLCFDLWLLLVNCIALGVFLCHTQAACGSPVQDLVTLFFFLLKKYTSK